MKKNYFKKGLIVGAIFGSLIAASFVGYVCYISYVHVKQNNKVNKSARFEDIGIKLTNLDGTPVNFSKYANKYVFMNFWATWCAPCLGEMPLFQRTYQDVKDKYVFIMVADHELDTIKTFKEKHAYDFVFVKSNKDLQSVVGLLPTTFILDQSQNIIFKTSGAFDTNQKDFKTFLLQKIAK